MCTKKEIYPSFRVFVTFDRNLLLYSRPCNVERISALELISSNRELIVTVMVYLDSLLNNSEFVKLFYQFGISLETQIR